MPRPDEKNVNAEVHERLFEEFRRFSDRHGMSRKRLVAVALHHLMATADLSRLQSMLDDLVRWEEAGRPPIETRPSGEPRGGGLRLADYDTAPESSDRLNGRAE